MNKFIFIKTPRVYKCAYKSLKLAFGLGEKQTKGLRENLKCPLK